MCRSGNLVSHGSIEFHRLVGGDGMWAGGGFGGPVWSTERGGGLERSFELDAELARGTARDCQRRCFGTASGGEVIDGVQEHFRAVRGEVVDAGAF